MDRYEISQIFGIPILKINKAFELNSKEKEYINSLEMEKKIEPLPEECLSISKNLYVLESEELKNVKQNINNYVNKYIDEIICVNNLFKMTNSWVVKSKNLHKRHDHKNTILSCVYYVKADNAKLEFSRNYNFITESFYFDLNYHALNVFNSTGWTYPVTTGDLLIFPGNTLHKGINLSDSTKTILAANYFITGEIGKNLCKTSLNIK
tara:strand:- start:3978 stop:4601 length:624 start_codon:yes stop_codon:yes gene_type:complete